jgi:hypothetical protein
LHPSNAYHEIDKTVQLNITALLDVKSGHANAAAQEADGNAKPHNLHATRERGGLAQGI